MKDVKLVCKLVAVFDMVVGILVMLICGILLRSIYKDDMQPKAEAFHSQRPDTRTPEKIFKDNRRDTILVGACSGVQCIIGALLYLGVSKHITPLCRLWQIISFPLATFTLPWVFKWLYIGWVGSFCTAVKEGRIQVQEETDIRNNEISRVQWSEPLQPFHIRWDTHTAVIIRDTHTAPTSNCSNTDNSNDAGTISIVNLPPEYEQPPDYDLGIKMPPAKL